MSVLATKGGALSVSLLESRHVAAINRLFLESAVNVHPPTIVCTDRGSWMVLEPRKDSSQ